MKTRWMKWTAAGVLMTLALVVIAGILWAPRAAQADTYDLRVGGTGELPGSSYGGKLVVIPKTVVFTEDAATTSDVQQLFNVPAGTLVLGISAVVTTAEGTTCTVDIGDGDSATTWFSNLNLNSAANNWSKTATGLDKAKYYATAGVIKATFDNAASAGTVRYSLVAVKP